MLSSNAETFSVVRADARAELRADECAEAVAETVCRNRADVGAEVLQKNGSDADQFADDSENEIEFARF